MAWPGKNSRKLALMVEAYKGPARLNVTEAARVAGYSFPEKVGHRVFKRYRELFQRAEDELRQSLIMDGKELDERITELARNPKHRDHFKALELLARMQGKLSEKVNITIDRSGINNNLDELIRSMTVSRAVQRGIAIVAAGDALLTTGTSQQPTADTVEGKAQPK